MLKTHSDVWIIVPPRSESAWQDAAPAVGQAQPPQSHKALRAFLHRELRDIARFNIGSTASRTGRVPEAVAGGSDAPLPVIQVRDLDRIGVLLASGVTESVRRRLTMVQADLLPDQEIMLVSPLSGPDSQQPDLGSERIGAASAESRAGRRPLGQKWHLSTINHQAATAKNLRGNGVRIGFLDTGINLDHPEFTLGSGIKCQHFSRPGDEPNQNETISDWHGHGSHVAALAAGRCSGIAPGAEIRMAAVLTTEHDGWPFGTLSQVLKGLQWLGDEDVAIINFSLGFDDRTTSSSDPALVTEFRRIVRQFTEQGIVAAGAIGNDGANDPSMILAPGKWPEIIGVGATDPWDEPAHLSVWDKAENKPDLYAPGVGLHSAWAKAADHRIKVGTSMAAPLVAGTLGLLIEREARLGRHNLTPDDLRNALLALTTTVAHPARGSFQRLDLSEI